MEGAVTYVAREANPAARAEPTVMQALLTELSNLTSTATANLMAVTSQRQRLLGDLPPEPPRSEKVLDANLAIGAPVSFNDVSGALDRLRGVLQATNEHVLSMRKIG